MMKVFSPATTARRLTASEDGSISVLSLQIFIGALVLGGLAIDVANAFANRTKLQVAADSAAHAALYTREWQTPQAAKETASGIAAGNMPVDIYGVVLENSDVVFGRWDAETQSFSPDNNSRSAVQVTTHQSTAAGNGVGTFLLRTVGLSAWDISARSIYTAVNACGGEGFSADGPIEIQSNNYFGAGFCVHSQQYVKASSGNTFETGAVVSMPDVRNVVLPTSGIDQNPGLAEALRDGARKNRILQRINDITAGILNPTHPDFGIMTATSPYYRSYITDSNVVHVAKLKDFKDLTIEPGKIYDVQCSRDKMNLRLDSTFVIEKAALVTNCDMTFADGATLTDAVLISTNNLASSASGSAKVTIGVDDNCADGGGSTLISRGSVDFSAGLSLFGSQILAAGDVSITSNADGVEGASIVAGGKIDVTSNGTFGVCDGDGMGNTYQAPVFRMAM